MKNHHVALFFSLFLGACAPRPAVVPATYAGIDLAPITMAEANPEVREACEASIHRALQGHGFRIEPDGPHVEVEASFWQDPSVDRPLGAYQLDSTSMSGAGATGAPTSQRSSYTADLTATIKLGSTTRKTLSSGSADITEQVQRPGPTGGASRISACAMAAERLAEAMVEELNHAAR